MKNIFATLKRTNTESDELFDPSSISVLIHDKNNDTISSSVPTRLSMGRYMATIDESILTNNEAYEVIWLYDDRVLRYNFTYNRTFNALSNMCYVYGSVEYFGGGLANSHVKYTTLKNGYSSHFSSVQGLTITDALGEWGAYFPVNAVISVEIPDINEKKTILTPTITMAAYVSLSASAFQTSENVNKFGSYA